VKAANAAGMLKLQTSDCRKIRDHGEAAYPNECCGILVGRLQGDVRVVEATLRCQNTRTDSPHNRYHIDPLEVVRCQREARQRGWEIVGFYHSHPDHPAQWSPTDLEEAHWIGCSYVITSVENARVTHTNSFVLTGSCEEDKRLLDEEIVIAVAPADSLPVVGC
jgi:proteasome lid subunit RPN8/RPN11